MKKTILLSVSLLTGIEMMAQTINTFPHNENFESFTACSTTAGAPCALTNNWVNDTGDDIDWTTDAGGTPSTGTGPGVDHNPGTAAGKYLYTESSGVGAPNRTALLLSPYFDFSALSAPRVSIWYHMLGGDMATAGMHIDARVGSAGIWTLDIVPSWTDNIDLWQEQIADLSAFAGIDSVQFRIRGITGSGFTSDMAIDDITVFQPAPWDLSLLFVTMPPGACGLGLESVDAGIVNNGSMTLAAGDSLVITYNDGTTMITDTIVLGINIAPGDTIVHTFLNVDFSVAGTYNALVWVNDSVDNTNDTLAAMLVSKPTITTFPYYEDFESGANGWTENNGANGTWAFGNPAKPIINSAASGVNAWVTNLTGLYNNNDNSYVEGPCFDFTNMCNPVIELDIWWNAEFSWDGAVLQSSVDGGMSWQNVGAMGDPFNWYTDNSISGNPGGQQTGWSGRNSTGNGSGTWVTARHQLIGLDSTSGVILRIAFGTDGSVTDEGFAFDNIHIYDWIADLGSSADICMGDSLQLSVAGSFPGTTFLWSTGETTPSIYVDTNGIYSVNVTSLGCSSSDSVMATILDTVISLDLGTDISTCAQPVNLDAGTHNGATYQWNTGDNTQNITVNTTGTYFVNVSSSCASASDTVNVTINNIPVVIMNDYNYDTICLNNGAIPLPAVFPSGGTYSGPGVSGTMFNPSAAGTGMATTVYTYTDGNGCTNSDTSTIFVDPCTGIAENENPITTEIFPNPGDGLFNLIINTGGKTIDQIVVYDVNGKVVYSVSPVNQAQEIRTVIDLSGFPGGIYMLGIVSDAHVTMHRLVLVK